jgi:integrase
MTRSSQKTETTVIGNWIAERQDRKYKMREIGTERQFTLHQESAFRWKVSGISSDDSRRRERISATALDEAINLGVDLLYPEIRVPPTTVVSYDLAEAFSTAIESTHGQKENRGNLFRYAEYFTAWAEKEGLKLWSEVRRDVVDRYVNYLIGRGLKRKTILNYLEPLRLTGRRLAESCPEVYHNPAGTLRLRGDLGLDGLWREDDGNEALNLGEVIEFADWLLTQPQGAILRPGVLLSGIMGLRMREVIYLTWHSVDVKEGTVTVQKEEGHKPKNRYSVRKLPMPRIVLECLRSLPRTSPRVVPAEMIRKVNRGKTEFLELLANFYSGLLNDMLERWRPGIRLTGKDLRNTLQTHAIENANEWNVYLVDRFCGHAPKSVMEKHYFADRNIRMVDLFRREVTARLDDEIDRVAKARRAQDGTKWHDEEKPEPDARAQVVDLNQLMG